jgi:hypothetical protein
MARRLTNITIIALCLILGGCATIEEKQVRSTPYSKDWCYGCGNKGWIPCDNCWDGKMLDGSRCYKCNGTGKLKCPVCFGKCNPNGEWK